MRHVPPDRDRFKAEPSRDLLGGEQVSERASARGHPSTVARHRVSWRHDHQRAPAKAALVLLLLLPTLAYLHQDPVAGPRTAVVWSPHDWWVGCYLDTDRDMWCVSIVPTLVIEILR